MCAANDQGSAKNKSYPSPCLKSYCRRVTQSLEALPCRLISATQCGCRPQCMKLRGASPIQYPYWTCQCTVCTAMEYKQTRGICMGWIISVTLCPLRQTKLNMVTVMALSIWLLFKPVQSKLCFASTAPKPFMLA